MNFKRGDIVRHKLTWARYRIETVSTMAQPSLNVRATRLYGSGEGASGAVYLSERDLELVV